MNKRKISHAKLIELVRKQEAGKRPGRRGLPDIVLRNLEVTGTPNDEFRISVSSRSLSIVNCSFAGIGYADFRLAGHSSTVRIKDSSFRSLNISFGLKDEAEENFLSIEDCTIGIFVLEAGSQIYELEIRKSGFDDLNLSGTVASDVGHVFDKVQVGRSINLAYKRQPLYIDCSESMVPLIRMSNPTVPLGVTIGS